MGPPPPKGKTMNTSEWRRIAATRFHIIAGRDELISGSNNLDTARSLAASLSAGRKSPMHVRDTVSQRGYIRFWNGREVERVGL